MKAIIAAGGSGTRLRPLTFSSNKHLLPVANKPLLLYPFEAILETGIKEIGIIVNQTRPAVENLLGDGKKWGVKVVYIDQPEALGLAHVVKISEQFLDGQPFVYHLGDNIFTEGIMRPFRKFRDSGADALLTIIEHPENNRLGVPYFNESGRLEKVVEKPENPPNKFGVPGLYFFNHHVFEAFSGDDAVQPSARGELEITDLYTYLLTHGYQVEAEQVDGMWLDPGKFDDMLSANQALLDLLTDSTVEGKIDDYSKIRGRVKVGPSSLVSSSTIEGPVIIGDNCVIEDCVIGPHVSIADHCRLKGLTIRDSIVMEQTELEHIAKPVQASLIGRNSKVFGATEKPLSLFIGDYCNVRLD
jgi:glucose-1-phosphate thymidylyltransferase